MSLVCVDGRPLREFHGSGVQTSPLRNHMWSFSLGRILCSCSSRGSSSTDTCASGRGSHSRSSSGRYSGLLWLPPPPQLQLRSFVKWQDQLSHHLRQINSRSADRSLMFPVGAIVKRLPALPSPASILPLSLFWREVSGLYFYRGWTWEFSHNT